MNLEITVPEVVKIFKEIKEQPQKLFEMIRFDIREAVGQYLTAMMDAELTQFLGRKPYERSPGEPNHRNGSYGRNFTLKGTGEQGVQAQDETHGDTRWRGCLLSSSGLYFSEDGTALEVRPNRKGA